ncbi:MAG: YdcF family protein [Salinivirgaceae bacterium]|nr:YdcF family protein [Salinivirgaceae bacterium]
MTQRLSKPLKKYFYLFIIILVSVFIVLFLPDQIIHHKTCNKLYQSASEIPKNKVGLLLGTSKYIRKGEINLFYKNRIEATLILFNHQKIDYILISGDNGLIEYNEPMTIKNDLVKAGIPEERIFLDYAGFRTWDSMIRAKKVFGETQLTIISQKFQNERAIFIGRVQNMDVVGFNAQDVPTSYGLKTMVREKMARIKLFIDILINKKPKYLGDTIQIG